MHDGYDIKYTVLDKKNWRTGASRPGLAVRRPQTVVVYVVVLLKEMTFVLPP